MIKKHIILIGIFFSITLFTISASYYPGGSQNDPKAIGYDWRNNYLCNLFNQKAINGADNVLRPAAIFGLLLLCISFGIFFSRFSDKIKSSTSAKIIKYSGIGSMIFAFLVVTPYHDLMTTMSSVLALVTLFYISVFIFKSKLHLFKLLSIVCMVVLYFNNYIYYTRHLLESLPVMQKIGFLIIIILILGLEYFTKSEDFQNANHLKFMKEEKIPTGS